jgi:hypothetical protein
MNRGIMGYGNLSTGYGNTNIILLIRRGISYPGIEISYPGIEMPMIILILVFKILVVVRYS